MERRAHVDRPTVTAAAITAVVGAAFAAMLLRGRPVAAYYDLFLFHNGPTAVIAAWLSRLVLRRQVGNGAGRVLLAIGVLSAAHVSVATLADINLVAAGLDAPLAGLEDDFAGFPFAAKVLVCFMNWLWVPIAVLMIAILPLLFPDGTWPSRRWWPVPVAAVAGGTLMSVAMVVDAWPWIPAHAVESPAAVQILVAIGGPLVFVAAIGGLVALGVRWHRTVPARRRPFHVVGTTAAVVALVLVALYPWQRVWIPVSLLAIHAMVSAYALAAARYGLHDIEPFLGRAAVAALLSGVIAAIYAAVVLGIGSLLGRPFDDPVLPAVALATVALVMEPARRRARRLVDRLLFRTNADRTEVLSQVAAHASSSATGPDVLSDVTELLLRSTGAARAEAWLDDSARPAAAAGTGAADAAPVLTVPVTYDDRRFGELRLYARAPADLVGDAAALVTDVAHTVGVVLRNDELTAQLRTQLDELHSSRHRLVEAHDRGRRSLERDIHDGAQSRLIALRLRVGAIRARFAIADRELGAELDHLAEGLDAAVRALRDLARGLAPPLLEESGVAPALRAHTRTLPISVTVTGDRRTRYAPTVESAAYFCCLEAIQNAIRHGAATQVSVTFDAQPTALRFSVRDNGVGFDAREVGHGTGLGNISDRIAALGGCSSIESQPGAGACVSASIPAGPVPNRAR